MDQARAQVTKENKEKLLQAYVKMTVLQKTQLQTKKDGISSWKVIRPGEEKGKGKIIIPLQFIEHPSSNEDPLF